MRHFSSVTNFLWKTVWLSSSNLGQRAVCVQRDAGLWSPSARRQTTLIKVRSSVSGVWCEANSVWRYICLPHASFPPSPPGVLLFWTCFNISWRSVCAAPPAAQHALNLHIFGGMQTWRSGTATDTDAGVSTNVCVDEEDGEHDVQYVQLLSEHRLKYCFSVKLLRLFDFTW